MLRVCDGCRYGVGCAALDEGRVIEEVGVDAYEAYEGVNVEEEDAVEYRDVGHDVFDGMVGLSCDLSL